jgi:hypothetical protein
MTIREFIEQAINEVKSGINEFNEENDYAKAYYPNEITFELMVDSKGFIGGPNKITITVPVTPYHPACDRKKE